MENMSNQFNMNIFGKIDIGVFFYKKLQNVILGAYLEKVSDYLSLIITLFYVEVYITCKI